MADDETQNRIFLLLDALSIQVGATDSKIDAIANDLSAGMGRVERRLGNIENRVESLETEVRDLKTEVRAANQTAGALLVDSRLAGRVIVGLRRRFAGLCARTPPPVA